MSELRLLRPDSPPFWAQLEATAARDGENGSPVCRVVMSDITKQRQADDKLSTAYVELEVRVEERTAEF